MTIKECHVILDQSQRRISYVHLCKNTNEQYFSESDVTILNNIFDNCEQFGRLNIVHCYFHEHCNNNCSFFAMSIMLYTYDVQLIVCISE